MTHDQKLTDEINQSILNKLFDLNKKEIKSEPIVLKKYTHTPFNKILFGETFTISDEKYLYDKKRASRSCHVPKSYVDGN